jgi:opacity protein-like surface antigen
MKLLLAFATSVALLAAAPYAAHAGDQTVIRDSGRRNVGTATTSGNQKTYRDVGGRTTGTATRSESGHTTYSNNRGSTIGTSSR